MQLTLESCVREINGVIAISVFIQNKDLPPKLYTYHLNSDYFSRKFCRLYLKGKKYHGRALQILKRNNHGT